MDSVAQHEKDGVWELVCVCVCANITASFGVGTRAIFTPFLRQESKLGFVL